VRLRSTTRAAHAEFCTDHFPGCGRDADAGRRGGLHLRVVPDLHGDLVEIGVRPTVLGGTVVHLYFAGLAMFGFALIAGWALMQSVRGIATATLPLAVAALVEIVFGAIAFSSSQSPHHLGPIASGMLLLAALVMPDHARRPV
jgi:hypothetical protein